ncbi:MAG TPA: hypothetical protein VEI01_21095 [Terriglobales bacterium]|nr:hypothetical protein [Terriglobales bacterium]
MWTGFLLTLSLLLLPCVVLAQQQENPPKADLFVGYQWLNPGGNIPASNGSGGFVPSALPSEPAGFGVAFGYNFHPNFALEADFGSNFKTGADITTLSVGPRFTWRGEGLNVFAHTLLGLNNLRTTDFGSKDGLGAILGGGIDLPIVRRLTIRLIEADWVWSKQNFSDDGVPTTQPDLRRASYNGVRLRGGLVFNFGGAPVVPPAASCALDHTEVMQGEPITATVSPTNYNPKHTLAYSWSGNGGAVSGKDTSATIDTKGVAGGTYTVTAHVNDPKMKKGGETTCSANFTVKEPPKNPPTMSCTANPASVQTGTPVTVTCTCTSPDGVPVTVGGWTASGGSIAGSGSEATLTTTGASPGTITVNATCTDSRGLTTSASSQATVENPPPPPPKASKLSQCDFPNKVKPWRVDNTCKAILDDVALRMQQEPDAKLVIVGNAEPTEKRKNLAAERAVDSKAYLSGGEAKQAIDPSRIETRTGNGGTRTAEYWIVPAGATFDTAGTEPVDEGTVKAIPDHPAPKKKAGKKAQ